MTDPIEDSGPGTVLCRLDDIPDPSGKEFRVGRRERFFVVRRGAEIFAYVNLCPHQGVSLEWKDDTFLTYDKTMILCGTHGALFEIETGICLAGPCLGRGLKPVAVRLDGDMVVLDE